MFGVLDSPGSLFCNGWYLAIHVEELALIQTETLNNVLKRVGVDGLFECLP